MGEETEPVSWPTDAWKGETGALARDFDWSATPLGPLSGWPRALLAIVSFAFESAQPAYIAWGPDLTSLYNDGYIPFLGTKHPEAFGTPYRSTWAEIWEESPRWSRRHCRVAPSGSTTSRSRSPGASATSPIFPSPTRPCATTRAASWGS